MRRTSRNLSIKKQKGQCIRIKGSADIPTTLDWLFLAKQAIPSHAHSGKLLIPQDKFLTQGSEFSCHPLMDKELFKTS